MGFGDWLSHGAGSELWNPSKALDRITGGPVAGPPGTNDKIKGTDNLVDNGDGTTTDLSTGQTFLTVNGNPAALTAPNVSQQVGVADNRAKNFLNSTQPYVDREGQTFGQEQGLVGQYLGVLGGTAPSLAQAQLGQGLDAINSNGLSAAAGVSGASSPMAQMLAARNAARASADTNQSAAIIRAQETAAARAGLGNTLNAMSGQSQSMYGTNLGAGLDLSKLAMEGEQGREGEQIQADAANRQARANLVGGVGGALVAKGTSRGGGGGGN